MRRSFWDMIAGFSLCYFLLHCGLSTFYLFNIMISDKLSLWTQTELKLCFSKTNRRCGEVLGENGYEENTLVSLERYQWNAKICSFSIKKKLKRKSCTKLWISFILSLLNPLHSSDLWIQMNCVFQNQVLKKNSKSFGDNLFEERDLKDYDFN